MHPVNFLFEDVYRNASTGLSCRGAAHSARPKQCRQPRFIVERKRA
ncbi:hypothetical protein [Mesorhizobium sp. WSM3868]|nr:hypothetical protein [Mesorhizobium sp. WSM3868]PBB35779.1 hypothetical protein CK221_17515 [Mesorhizobium sp. WSM3868]